jgi:hypothetical protein
MDYIESIREMKKVGYGQNRSGLRLLDVAGLSRSGLKEKL